jgi:hypothetical protein
VGNRKQSVSGKSIGQSSKQLQKTGIKMLEPSPHVRDLIAAKSAVKPGSISPREFNIYWRDAKQCVTNIAAELTVHDSDFQRMSDEVAELVDLVQRLRVADADLRQQTPNGKRPRHYVRPEIDHAQDIERKLMEALSFMKYGDSHETLTRLLQLTGDAFYLTNDAWQESLKTRKL